MHAEDARPVSALPRPRPAPGRRDELRELAARMAGLTNREHGPLHYSAGQLSTDTDVFVIFELWPDQGSVDAHLRSPAYQALSAEAAQRGLLVSAEGALTPAPLYGGPIHGAQLLPIEPATA